MGLSYIASMFSHGSSVNANMYEALKLFALGTLMELGRRFCKWAFERFKIRYSISAQFNQGDPAYEWLLNYLTQEKVWNHSQEFIVSAASSQLQCGINLDSGMSAEYIPKYDTPHLFQWKGYWAEIQKMESFNGAGVSHSAHQRPSGGSVLLTMYTRNINALSSLVEEAHFRYLEGRRPHVIVHSIDFHHSASWNVVKRKNRRPLESIVLSEGSLAKIVQDVADFLQTEEWYIQAGIPYRRGYLLYGPPGTGKTSTIYALAGEFGLEIYSLSLSSESVDDNTLHRAVSALPKHSILLLEDIDCAFPSRDHEEFDDVYAWTTHRQKTKTGVTMSGLLNVLDGVGCEDGKLFFATTNYIDRLDPALIRPGRVDMRLEYKLATKSQTFSLFSRFYSRHPGSALVSVAPPISSYPTPPESPVPSHPATPPPSADRDGLAVTFTSLVPEEEFTTAELQGYLLSYRNNPKGAVWHIQEWVKAERIERERRRRALDHARVGTKAATGDRPSKVR
ncbi:hypothetical protein AMATHDRAFT_61510 [Amanita thiersii Skay4041]|uniref:AAA+ ATPase domain-containing protein n=1 Tax=Amanita thiersii Skay4041 TaxID=703135 RepID=A0A2A9NGQ7_9AGAR|nr:hypothetical protein AMATHDRAFT_61510 [Amanita thiersii Skay4041]